MKSRTPTTIINGSHFGGSILVAACLQPEISTNRPQSLPSGEERSERRAHRRGRCINHNETTEHFKRAFRDFLPRHSNPVGSVRWSGWSSRWVRSVYRLRRGRVEIERFAQMN